VQHLYFNCMVVKVIYWEILLYLHIGVGVFVIVPLKVFLDEFNQICRTQLAI
jgi:hypothetical protein